MKDQALAATPASRPPDGMLHPSTTEPAGEPRHLSYAEAIDNPCASCSTSPCCRYLPLGSFAVATLADFDHAGYLLNFENIELGISADGTWSAYYTQACRFLDDDSRCSLHGTPEKPHICVQYNPYSCWYRPALAGPGHPDYLRIDRARFDVLKTMVAFDELRALAGTPSWEELRAAFEGSTLRDLVDAPRGTGDDAGFGEWQEIVLGTRPPRERTVVAADPKLTRTDPCTGCGAYCCTSLLFTVASPTTASGLDYIRFALGFPGTELVVSGDVWSIAVRTTCRHLDGGRCSVYGSPDRPVRCQYLDAWACSFKAVFDSPRPEHALRVRHEEFDALASMFSFDEFGVATEIPPVDQLRAAIEGSWLEGIGAVSAS